MKYKTLVKIVATICFILLTIGIIVAWNSPTKGYESSIYTATPPIFWVAIVISLVVGIIFFIIQIASKNELQEFGFPWIPFLLVFISFAALLSLTILRGYTLYAGGDPITHIGRIQDLLLSGHVDNDNYYPVTHLLMAQLSEVSNISPILMAKFVPLIFSLLGVLYSYCLARIVLPERGQVIMSTILSMTFLTRWFVELTPNCLINLYFPLVLFVIIKTMQTRNIGWNIIVMIIIFLIPPFHIIVSFALILMLVGFQFTIRFAPKFYKDNSRLNIFKPKMGPALIWCLVVWGITWITSFSLFGYEISLVYNLISGEGMSKIGALASQIEYSSAYNYSVIGMFIKIYGGILILIIFTVIAFIMLWKIRSFNSNGRLLFLLTGPFLLLGLGIIILYFGNFDFGPERLMVYIVIICNLFAAYALFRILKTKIVSVFNMRLSAYLLVIIVVLSLFGLGSLKLYDSRYNLATNSQVTKTEISGMNWFLLKNNTEKYTTYLWNPQLSRYADLLLSTDERNQRQDINYSVYNHDTLKLPWHFGYELSAELGQNYYHDLYLILNQVDRSVYTDLFPEMAGIRFENSDFAKLEQDKSVDKLYTNGGIDSYYIHGLAYTAK
jgi:hypothetical protein